MYVVSRSLVEDKQPKKNIVGVKTNPQVPPPTTLAKGVHITYDFVGFSLNDAHSAGTTVFALMQSTCDLFKITVVGKQIKVFDDPAQSPPGFASALLLDESHISAHAYTDETGLLAVDVFTCGNKERGLLAAQHLKKELLAEFPSLTLKQEHTLSRF